MKKKSQFSSTPQSPQTVEKDISKQIDRLFEVPDSDVDPISYSDARSYIKSLKEALNIANSSKEWDDQLYALKQIMSLIKGGAFSHNQFLQQIPQIIPIITENIVVSRSTLVKTTCLLVAQIAMTIGPQFEAGAETLIPVLIKPTTHGTQIIADSCNHAILCITQYVCTHKVAKCIVAQISSKAAPHRILCARCFIVMLKFWAQNILEKERAIIGPAIDRLTADASPDARSLAREAKSILQEASKNMKPPQNPKQKKDAIDSSAKRRAASVGNKKRAAEIDRTFKLDDVKQMVIMSDENSIKENADAIVKIVVNGMTGTSPIIVTTCFTLFTETVNVIPEQYKTKFDTIVKTLYLYDAGNNQKQKKLADTALASAVAAFGANDVIAAGLNQKDPSYNKEIIMELFGKNEININHEVKTKYEKAFGLNYEASLMFEAPPPGLNDEKQQPKEEKQENAQKPNFAMTMPNKKPEIVPGSQNPPKKPPPIQIPPKQSEEIQQEQKETTIIIPNNQDDEEAAKQSPLVVTNLVHLGTTPESTLKGDEIPKTVPQTDLVIAPSGKEVHSPVSPDKTATFSNASQQNTSQSNAQKPATTVQSKLILPTDQKKQSPATNKKTTPTTRQSAVIPSQSKITPTKKQSESKPKEVDFRPKKDTSEIRTKKQTNTQQNGEQPRFSIPPFSTDLDPEAEPDTQAERLVRSLNGPDPGAAIRRIAQYANRHGARDYRVLLPAILPFMHSEYKEDAQFVVDAIVRNVQHSQLLDLGSSLLAECPREAAEFLSDLSKICSAGEIMDFAPYYMGGLKCLSQDPLPEVRKAAIFCIADMWVAAGDDFISEVDRLPPLTKKLATHYYNQKK